MRAWLGYLWNQSFWVIRQLTKKTTWKAETTQKLIYFWINKFITLPTSSIKPSSHFHQVQPPLAAITQSFPFSIPINYFRNVQVIPSTYKAWFISWTKGQADSIITDGWLQSPTNLIKPHSYDLITWTWVSYPSKINALFCYKNFPVFIYENRRNRCGASLETQRMLMKRLRSHYETFLIE